MAEEAKKCKRGFASMDPELARQIQSKGGSTAPAEKRTFSMDRELAKAAGRKGAKKAPSEKRPFYTDRSLAARAGRKGGSVREGTGGDKDGA